MADEGPLVFAWMPDFLKPLVRPLWPETISWDELVNEMNASLQLPGQTNAWTMPIKNRIDMLTTGIRTPVGIKIFGADLAQIERIARQLEPVLQAVPGTRSVYGERVAGGFFVDFDLKRREIARYGLTIKEVQDVIMSAIGGENVTTTIEGRERYPVNVRYPRELRDDPDKLARTLVPTMSGAQIPLSQLADIRWSKGLDDPRRERPALRLRLRRRRHRQAGHRRLHRGREGGRRAVGEAAPRAISSSGAASTRPWSGFGRRCRSSCRSRCFSSSRCSTRTRSPSPKTFIVLLAVPFSAVGAIWLLYALGYHISIGVWVGLIALLGLDAETGVFMLLYLDLAYDEAKASGRDAATART